MCTVQAIVAVCKVLKVRDRLEWDNEKVVRSHICPWLSVFLGQHERHKVYLAQRTRPHDSVIRISIIFLVVCSVNGRYVKSIMNQIERTLHEVFDGSSDPSALYTVHIRRGNDTRKKRVFGEAFEALSMGLVHLRNVQSEYTHSSPEWVTLYITRRR